MEKNPIRQNEANRKVDLLLMRGRFVFGDEINAVDTGEWDGIDFHRVWAMI